MRVSIFGASGYSGLELLRWLRGHPAQVVGASSSKWSERPIDDVIPGHPGAFAAHEAVESAVQPGDVAFLATPAQTSLELAPRLLDRGASVIDLSGAFRLPADMYPDWYGFSHDRPDLLERAHYGLVDLVPAPRADGTPTLVANPGCYATAAALALAPLVRAGWTDGPIFADGKSGSTGAGKKPEERLLFSELGENLSPYKAGVHQHAPEIEGALARYAGTEARVLFAPHLIPMQRGLLVSAYAHAGKGEGRDPNDALRDAYRASATVQVVDAPPSTGPVRGTPCVRVHARLDARTGAVMAFGALDNLVKGAAGQAIENLNRLLALAPGTGLQA